MTKSCKLVLAVRGRDIDTFAATRKGLVTAQRAAERAARGIGHPAATVTQVCGGREPEVLVKCSAKRCTSGLAGVRRRRRSRVLQGGVSATRGLWRYDTNPASPRWVHERDVTDDTAAEWLAVFRRDAPNADFRLMTAAEARRVNQADSRRRVEQMTGKRR